MASKMTRGEFLVKGAAGLAAGLSIIPSNVLGKSFGATAPSDRLNIAGVGVGGRGAGVLKEFGNNHNIVSLVDTDWKYAKNTFERYPKAKRYYDYREMLDKQHKDIDVVMVATPDHTHAMIAADSMTLGKHVYCEKPLTHSVYESRLLTNLAASTGVATQMGNQGSSAEGVRLLCDWIWNGEIGEITKVDTFTDRPIWPQGLERPIGESKIPKTLDWDLFIGPANMRPFNEIYSPWNWRGWWDFGTGALGDMACHILHPVFTALKLGYPTTVQGSSTALLTDCAPSAEMVVYKFPARENMSKLAMPPVEVVWYDGGLTPPRPEGLPAGKDLNVQGGGVIFHGTKDTLICGCYGASPYLLSGRTPKVPSMSRVVELNHAQDFLRACTEPKESRVNSVSDFSVAGQFNEMVVMGVLAVRLQKLHKELEWDGVNMKFTNISPSETLRIMKKDGFSIKDGHPSFNKEYTEPMNALRFADEMIKHNYRPGWNLVNMPK